MSLQKVYLANLPTKIVKLANLSQELNANVYMKRDDQTGSELSGNKVRKLEFAIAEGLSQNCDMLITCGGIQSNHCRATTAAAASLGMNSAVLLRVPKIPEPGYFNEEPRGEGPEVRGNFFLDMLFGAEVFFCNPEQYRENRGGMMSVISEEYKSLGFNPYVIPEGASNGVGSLGYYKCMQEIVEQEQEYGVIFDTIVVATGSGGTVAGLNLANRIHGYGKRIIGICVCDDNAYFQPKIAGMANEAFKYLVKGGEIEASKVAGLEFKAEDIEMNDKYVGRGYALNTEEELEFIKKIARMEGVVLDPVYTGKAMYALYNELSSGEDLKKAKNILFIHTGGMYGLFPKSEEFKW